MKFGQSYEDSKTGSEVTGNSSFIRYFKKPATTFRILQNPEEWVSYWEHFNPGGHPFPCTGDRNACPGCTSDNDKMSRASKRVAINVLEGEYVNVYKFPKTLAEKLENRAQRIGTVTDRDYTIYKMQSQNTDGSIKTEYDIEGGDKIAIDLGSYKTLNVEEMLASAYEDSWGEGNKTETVLKIVADTDQEDLEKKTAEVKEEPKDKTYTEEELREMDLGQILTVCEHEGVEPPKSLMSTKEVVDWLLEQ